MDNGTRVGQLRDALASGEAFTRLEAIERFGISGSTFRWAIRSLCDEGVPLVYDEVPGRRGSALKRWRILDAAPARSDG